MNLKKNYTQAGPVLGGVDSVACFTTINVVSFVSHRRAVHGAMEA